MPPSSSVWLCCARSVLLFGQVLRRRRFPARPLKQCDCVVNGHGKIRCRVLGKNRKCNSDYFARRSEQRSARSTFASACVVNNALRIEVRDIPLSHQRADVVRLSQITQQRFSRAVTILDSSRFVFRQHSDQTIWSGWISHRHDDLANRHGLGPLVERQHRNLWRQVF